MEHKVSDCNAGGDPATKPIGTAGQCQGERQIESQLQKEFFAWPVKEMAVTCVDTLIKLIEKKPVERRIILPVTFVEGGTTR